MSECIRYNLKSKLILLPVFFCFSMLFSCNSSTTEESAEEKPKPSVVITDTTSAKGNVIVIDLFERDSIQCEFDQLSDQFNVHLYAYQMKKDSAVVKVKIKDKENNVTQRLSVPAKWLPIEMKYEYCRNVHSLTTGFRAKNEVISNDHGVLVVADFNFDDLDDLAVGLDFLGNGGTIYAYYLKNKQGKFVYEDFLSKQMRWFPIRFDKENKTLKNCVHANTYQNRESIYQLNDDKWKLISDRIVDQ